MGSSSDNNAPSPDSPSSQSPSKSPPSPPPQKSSPPPPQESSPPSSSNSPTPESSPYSPPPPSSNNDRSPPPPKSGSNNPSPPPPRHSSSSNGTKAPPPAKHSSQSGQTSSSESSDVNVGVYIGIGVGVGVGLFVMALIICCVACGKKKKRKRETEMQYYSAYQGGNQYYNSSQQPNWHNGPNHPDHVVKLSTHGSPGSGSGGGGWGAPPPPMMSSGEMSSNYSVPRPTPLPPPSPAIALGFNQSTFTYDELAAATGGFAQANVLGQGGFGYVHKGVFPNGKEVAVKSLKTGSGQGEREFQAEVEIISRVHHRHLVSLVGYCIAGGQRMLVYEFVSNKTMEYHLHGKGLPTMDWPTRLRIALGSAKGLAYLHEDCHPRIIHRDIKAANILLDSNFEAMVADFGLAKLSSDNNTHVSTRVMGTFGYLAPEYASSGKLTEKSDVFSYGIMLLELITGKRPVDNMNMEDSLVDWARPLLLRAMDEGNFNELVDLRLEMNYDPEELSRMIACAAASIRHSARKRSKMSQIVRALQGDASLEALNEGVRPGQSSVYSSSNVTSEYDTTTYKADMKKFRQIAFTSEEFTSSEHGAPSSNESPEMRKSNF